MTLARRIIQSEHFEIGLVLTCLDRLVAAMKQGIWEPDFDLLFLVQHYIEAFPTTFHHPKEEEYLFAALRRCDPASAALIDQLCDEHAEGLALIDEMRAALGAFRRRTGARDWYFGAATSFIEAERAHIRCEENTILPLALAVLQPRDWLQINTAFAENVSPLLGPERKAQFDALFGQILRLVPGTLVFGITGLESRAAGHS